MLVGVQAWCDLALPTYTSEIVDVGLAASGIEDELPRMLPAEEYAQLVELFPQAAELYLPFEESHPNYAVLSVDFPLHEGAYVLTEISAEQAEMLAEAIRQVYIQTAGNAAEGSGSTVISYILRSYRALGVDIEETQMNYIIKSALRMMGIVMISVCAAVMIGYCSAYAGSGFSRDLRSAVFTKALSFSPSEFDKFSTASLITRSTNDIQQIQMMLIMSTRMITYAPMMAIGGIIKVLTTNAGMSWITALGVGLILLMMTVLMSVTMPKFKIQQKLIDKLNLVSREVLTGLPVIRAFGTEKKEIERFKEANTNLMNTGLFVNRVMAVMHPFMTVIMNGSTLLIVWVGARHISEGNLQVGDMIAFINYATHVIMSFLMVSMMSISAPRALVSVTRVAEVLQAESSIRDPEQTDSFDPAKAGTVEFDHVDFAYPGAEHKVLHDITFTANPGEMTAIIGATGCGKSTLVNLIPRFFDVTGGSVKVEGVDVRHLRQTDLRDKIGLVPQKSVLFSGTIRSNLAFSDPTMAEARLTSAAQVAQAEEFISTRPEGLDASIAQGGANVSGGQKQRLAIARALAKEAPIYIFDDSFSALDYKTDRRLRAALVEKTRKSAVLIVAQRISTVMGADKIIVLDEGRIAGMGTHAQLMETCEEYREIAYSQLSKEELANG
ncbi:MAG: ABC transporter ATP-binding protein [Clostridia bacterium]|nr:ABC transporter ATP-binding protein [Clostridia bacterium]